MPSWRMAMGGDKPMEGVTAAQAREFCLKLKGQKEAPAAAFALPSIAQWQQAKAKHEALGLKGMNDELHEWTSNVHGDGLSPLFPQPPFFRKPVGKDFPVAMTTRGPMTLEPDTTSQVTIRAQTRSVVLWSGRLGFRVVLIPKS